MSDTVRKDTPCASNVASGRLAESSELDDQLADVLTGIEDVLSVIPPPMTGWSAIPPERARSDGFAELTAQLEAERHEPELDLIDAFGQSRDERIADQLSDSSPAISVAHEEVIEDEPTRDWTEPTTSSVTLAPVPPPVRSVAFISAPDLGEPYFDSDDPGAREEMPSLADSMEDAPATLRPSAVSLPPYRPRRRPRVPTGLALGAALAVTAAIVAYRLGPHSQPTASADDVAVATRVLNATFRAEAPQLTAAKRTVEVAPAEKERLIISVMPSNAYLSIRTLEEREGKRTTGPWPKAFDLVPGEYELVAFRAGHKPVLRRITVRPGVRPTPVELRLQVHDIYED